jgi:ATP-dependent Clp protease protease subunit
VELTKAAQERLLKERVVVVGKEIDADLANEVTAHLLLLDADDPGRDIMLYINTPGGSVTAAMSIYDTMQLISSRVVTLAMGLAAGVGALLLATGAHGLRCALPHSKLNLMRPEAGPQSPDDSPEAVRIRAELMAKWRREIAAILAERTGQTPEQIEADWNPPRWFTAAEALDYGLVDRIVEKGRSIRPRREMREHP